MIDVVVVTSIVTFRSTYTFSCVSTPLLRRPQRISSSHRRCHRLLTEVTLIHQHIYWCLYTSATAPTQLVVSIRRNNGDFNGSLLVIDVNDYLLHQNIYWCLYTSSTDQLQSTRLFSTKVLNRLLCQTSIKKIIFDFKELTTRDCFCSYNY